MRYIIKKYSVLFLIQIILLMVLLPGCFKKEEFIYANQGVVMQPGTESVVYMSERMQLRPGVYQIRIDTEGVEGGYLYVSVSSEQSSFRTLRCNDVVMFEGQSYIDFELYVLEKIDDAYVEIRSSCVESINVETMEVFRVNLGARILTFMFVGICMIIDFLLWLREGILSGKIKKEQQVVFWGLLLSVLIAYFPYMTDYISGAADIGFHWLRIEGLKETLLQGNQFPVRIQSRWLYDHGYAVSSFYGDLFLLIPVFLRLIGFSIMTAYKMFVFVIMAATALIAYYSLKRCTKHTYASLFGSIIYVLAPYRIYNFYNRGAIGEALAMTFLPLVICGMYELYTLDVNEKNYSKAKLPLIIGLSAILQSHLLTCEMVVMFMLFVCVIFFRKTFRKQTFVQLLQAAVLCLLLNVWFWLPLLQMMVSDRYLLNTIISGEIQSKGTWFAEIFQLYPNQGSVQDGMYMAEPFQMGIASLLMLVIVLVVSFRKHMLKKGCKFKNPYDNITLFWTGMILCAWMMSTRYFPWDVMAKVPGIKTLVSALQFPTRLFSPASVFCAFAATFFFLWFTAECKEWFGSGALREYVQKGCLLTLCILAVGSAVYHVNDLVYSDEPIWLYTAENMGTTNVVFGEYLLEGTSLNDYSYHDPIAESGLEWTDYEKQGTSVWIRVNNTNHQDAALELPLTGYKGYAVEGDASSTKAPYISEQRGRHGDLKIIVPEGYQGNLKIYYKGFGSYRAAEMVSLLTIVFVLMVWIKRRRGQWKVQIK